MAEWEKYPDFRKNQGFNMIQINSLSQHDVSGSCYCVPFMMDDTMWDLHRINPEYFRYLGPTGQVCL